MKTIILAGGLGTRLREETESKPKPMIPIGEKPILWHIMKIYSHYGFDEFILPLGYKSDVVKNWVLGLSNSSASFDFDLKANSINYMPGSEVENWKITALESGLDTQTGGRIKRAMSLAPGERVMATYGDGVANINIKKLLEFHESHGKLATVTAVRPPARFGRIILEDDSVVEFGEKLQSSEGWINGGFFVLEPEVASFINGDLTAFEGEPLMQLVRDNQLKAFRHDGFWQPMDTLREMQELQKLWESGKAPWAVWS